MLEPVQAETTNRSDTVFQGLEPAALGQPPRTEALVCGWCLARPPHKLDVVIFTF